MPRVLLDTDIFSELLKHKDSQVIQAGIRYLGQYERFTLSTMTVMEIAAGLQQTKLAKKIEMFLEAVHQHELLTLNFESAVLAGKIYAALERDGRRIGIADTIIAAIAIDYGLELVSGNTKHYQRIIELGYPLKLSNWRNSI